jgi:phosphoribosyl-AMP cyclohydrolase
MDDLIYLRYDSNGLIPAIIQDADTDQVLMLGYMNAESLQITLSSGKVTFLSRSRQKLWLKGETSGHYLLVTSISIDCDQGGILIKAEPYGPTCHTGQISCFFTPIETKGNSLGNN